MLLVLTKEQIPFTPVKPSIAYGLRTMNSTRSYSQSSFKTAQYLSLGTFRKTGVRVDTPVWFAEDGEFLYVLSNNQAGKIKRIRNSQRCQIAPCTMLGKTTGEWQDSTAVIIVDPVAIQCAHQALKKKYGWQMLMLDSGAWIGGRINQRTFIKLKKP